MTLDLIFAASSSASMTVSLAFFASHALSSASKSVSRLSGSMRDSLISLNVRSRQYDVTEHRLTIQGQRLFAHGGDHARVCAKASFDHKPGASERTPKI